MAKPWQEADPGNGYRASQYLLSFMWRIDKASREERKEKLAALAEIATDTPEQTAAAPAEEASPDGLSKTARAILPPLAKQNFTKLRQSSFAPHNKLGMVNEDELAAAYTPIPPRKLPKGKSGNVIVGCMKNEAPYIVEWVAYHRAIGVDNFLIYTNDCTDGTSEILDRLQEMGVLQHRNNDKWKGNSPQQYALNQALKEDVIKNADWIIHIDVDEFINVRTGNGTLDDFLKAVPDATNVAMTWRLFGHNGVTRLSDAFVIDQFETCAPKFCPKPHTVWGFKTMFKNIGAYEKISCHRPNKLGEAFKSKVKWVNGSGIDMTREAAEKGWRSSKKSIGYDLIQLNHYALRSAESFLIKRQRGRALHVDRSIGINYWIRMDWSDFRDITIKRNIPRLHAEYDRLMEDAALRAEHENGLEWHRAKAKELHAIPEFRELYEQALKIKLTETERVAYALALDMES
ncbi:glycosyltransferase family 2 protein [Aquicoccus sp. G2-2]|uniref:glycosyltransferase family 2 protein n=1 Tax=Aquicoccus sp. G2-2 TaxID=3092120 RepID=UPI002ADF1BC8|nr:glycosyltransferase family 2 protein [Aquicoccus sp. G2-2]MEA1112934.1 glycosyltransferase family 2 protein [Aquicoccus sp. G2-2]